MPFRFLPINKGASFEESLPVINGNFSQLDGEAITKLFNNLAGNPSFIEGKLPNDIGYGFLLYAPDNKVAIACYINAAGQPVLKVAKDGYDALTATDDQLIFNSEQNTFKIVASGTVNFTPANSGSPNFTVTSGRKTGPVVAHNLGYIPGVQCYTQRPSISFNPNVLTALPFLESNGSSSVLINAFYSITSTNLSFFFDFGGSWVFNASPDFVIKYYLLQETAS